MTAVLGCIADDFTGGTDLAETLSRNGMRTIQLLGVPDTALASEAAAQADALVVALKIRTVPVEEAVSQALAALEALRAAGCRQFFWKYCSTFDSTPKGNIGPVAEALLAKGAQLGTVLAFMMAVTTLSLPSMIMLRKAVKPRLLGLFIAICTGGIILIGYLFNVFQFYLISI
mgnify:FL=1